FRHISVATPAPNTRKKSTTSSKYHRLKAQSENALGLSGVPSGPRSNTSWAQSAANATTAETASPSTTTNTIDEARRLGLCVTLAASGKIAGVSIAQRYALNSPLAISPNGYG